METAKNAEYRQWMLRCLELAGEALEAGETPVGAIVVLNGHMIAGGRERTRASLDPSAHAEVEAIRAACAAVGSLDLPGAVLYTTVEPCVLCSYAIRRTKMSRVVYGAAAGAIGGHLGAWPVLTDTAAFTGLAVPEIQAGLLADECNNLLTEARRRRERA